MELNSVQKVACESVWRTVQHSGKVPAALRDVSGLPAPVAIRRIANYVASLPHHALNALVLPEFHRRGPLVSGYTSRWENITQASARYDAHIAADKVRAGMRMSEVPSFEQVSSASASSDAGSDSRPLMRQNDSGTTVKG